MVEEFHELKFLSISCSGFIEVGIWTGRTALNVGFLSISCSGFIEVLKLCRVPWDAS